MQLIGCRNHCGFSVKSRDVGACLAHSARRIAFESLRTKGQMWAAADRYRDRYGIRPFHYKEGRRNFQPAVRAPRCPSRYSADTPRSLRSPRTFPPSRSLDPPPGNEPVVGRFAQARHLGDSIVKRCEMAVWLASWATSRARSQAWPRPRSFNEPHGRCSTYLMACPVWPHQALTAIAGRPTGAVHPGTVLHHIPTSAMSQWPSRTHPGRSPQHAVGLS